MECMCAQTRPRYGVRTHVKSKGKIFSTEKILPRGGLNPPRCIKQDSEPNTLPMSYSGLNMDMNSVLHNFRD